MAQGTTVNRLADGVGAVIDRTDLEPSEHVYHYGDPASELREALQVR